MCFIDFSTKQLGVIFLFLNLILSVSAFQSTFLQVSVTDEKGALITDAIIKIKDKDGSNKTTRTTKNQEVTFSNLKSGKYILEIEAKGFRPLSQEVDVIQGKNEINIQLQVAEFVENVDVTRDKQETATEDVFSNFLTKEQIERLSDDPEEMERELKNQFGQDAIIRVDGFPGRLPPKSQIASIKVTRSSFDAEYHQLGVTIIDVTTKAGAGNWSGSVSTGFNDESLNARYPFAIQRFPSQQKRLDFFLSGPLVKKQSSLFISAFSNNSYKDESIVAVSPNGQLRGSVRNSFSYVLPWIKFTQNLSKTHFLGIAYQGTMSKSENNGVGEFNLQERAFSVKNSNHLIRVSEVGTIGKRFYNEFRLQYTNENSKINPNSDKTAIIVLDSFSDGGAGNKKDSRKNGIWFSDNLLFGLGKSQALKIGGLFEYEKLETESAQNKNGTFTFSSLNDLTLNKPTTFTQSLGTRKIKLSQIQLGAYLQDDVRLHKSFLLSLGLRYEWQNNLKDKNNISPRIGFSWSPNKRGKTTFRGGAGVYYDWFETNNLANVLSQDKTQPSEIVIINPSYPNPFLSGISQFLPKSFWQTTDNLKNPYIFLSSIGLEQRLNNTTSLRILYKYEKGVHQFRSRDINAPLNGLRPNPNFGRIVQVESSAFFQRKSLNIGLNGQLNKKVSYGIEYIWAKNMSDANGIFGMPSDNYNLRLDRSVSNLDQRHHIYASIFWKVRKGISFSTNLMVNSPLPYTITTGKDENDDTIFNDRPFGILRNSERGTWQKQVDMSLSWTFGLVKRKEGVGIPGTIVVSSSEAASGDIGISPNHKYSIKLYATANNVFNFTNFTNFVGVQTSPFFHQPISANNARRVDFGMRFSF
ncbi:MAG: carboxypeptidase regulatory-like domain-containing protein [Pyrinomonadaceae bacterium]|nr:carboxypeptidase regulatory-like domain-containing protein [Pyrinomonadaceae bacterium]